MARIQLSGHDVARSIMIRRVLPRRQVLGVLFVGTAAAGIEPARLEGGPPVVVHVDVIGHRIRRCVNGLYEYTVFR